MCGFGISGFTILIGTTSPFNNSYEVPYCQKLNNLNLGFVIVEWIMIRLFCCLTCMIILLGIGWDPIIGPSNSNEDNVIMRKEINNLA